MNMATLKIGRLALVMACFGLLALSHPLRASAAESDPSSNGTAQVLWCESMGGTAEVTEHRTNASGVTSVVVTCTGGLGGSWHCANLLGHTPDCQASRGSLPDWGNLADAQPLTPVSSSPTTPDASPSVASPDNNQEQDTNQSNGKKGKKGKKDGKGRKR